jgi:hypothetical protein
MHTPNLLKTPELHSQDVRLAGRAYDGTDRQNPIGERSGLRLSPGLCSLPLLSRNRLELHLIPERSSAAARGHSAA